MDTVDKRAYEWTPYALTINKIGNGTVTKNPEKTTYGYGYGYGDEVTLMAMADDGWNFSGWSGYLVSANNPLTKITKRNTTITANFKPIFKLFPPLILR